MTRTIRFIALCLALHSGASHSREFVAWANSSVARVDASGDEARVVELEGLRGKLNNVLGVSVSRANIVVLDSKWREAVDRTVIYIVDRGSGTVRSIDASTGVRKAAVTAEGDRLALAECKAGYC